MRISLNWLKEYIDIDIDADELARKMTMLGLEIETIERPWDDIKKVTVGQIQSIEPHTNADKLVVCKTDVGEGEPLQIVCGATNMSVGDKVPTAVVGATLPGGFKIAGRKMRGIESQGMMCSPTELGLGEDHSGLLILDLETPIGGDFIKDNGMDDIIFDVEITPNRGDWASMIGVARELAALFDKPFKVPETPIVECEGPSAKDLATVIIEDEDLCPRYMGRVLPSAKIGPSPLWMVRRLVAAGQRPINNIVDITNYVLLETGHPLHAFDSTLLADNKIVVRTAKEGETIITIDGETRNLTPDMLVIADADQPVAVAGVMGGQNSEVGERTGQVFLESAYFNPVSVRRTARTLGLQTEAAAHFQRGADPEMAEYAINRTASLMQQLAGAELAAGLIDEHPKPLVQNEVRLRYARTDAILGANIPGNVQKTFIQNLGFEIIAESDTECTARVPSWRHDVAHEADLIEEVARLYDYDNIEVTLPSIRQTDEIFAPCEAVVRHLRRFLVGLGLTETFHWTFSSPAEVERCNLGAEYENMIALENPLSENQATMRSSLLPTLMANVARNLNHGNLNIGAFEIGPVYQPIAEQELPDEPMRLAIVLSGAPGNKHWSRPEENCDFYDIKGHVEAVLDFFSAKTTIEEAQFGMFQDGQCGRVKLKKKDLGVFGQVDASVLKAHDVEQPVFAAEIRLDTLLEHPETVHQFQEIPQFPPSLRDLAVVVDDTVPGGELLAAAKQAGGKLLKTIDIFDVYTGEQVPDGKKSVALGLVFQSLDRTLTDKDTQKTCDKIVRRLQKDFQAELR